MLKIFLVDDESIVREGLRDNIPWQQYGYQFMGEASDGEMALPLIRKVQPDVLITDIKMPFMDGLALSRIVSQEFPRMKIIIISGYDDFEYARQAINVGVEEYLLKPITRSNLQKVLVEIREKIESEQEQSSYLDKFKKEMYEYEQFTRRNFFEKVLEGHLSAQEIYEEAQKLSLEIDAPCYNLALVTIQDSQYASRYQEELLRYFLRFTEYLVFRWNLNTYGILIKCEKEQMEEMTERCISSIRKICDAPDSKLEWNAAVGSPVERLSMLSDCYKKVNHILSYRFLKPSMHILTEESSAGFSMGNEEESFEKLDIAKVDPEIIKGFLMEGQKDEITEFVEGYLQSLKEGLKSKLFCNYLLLSIRFAVIGYAESLGCSQEEFLKELNMEKLQEFAVSIEDMKEYMHSLLEHAIELRDEVKGNQSKKIVKRALEYIDENYSLDTLSLNTTASATEVSSNYLSAVFSQEMKVTFIEYVTEKRMEKAKKLLRQTEMHSGEVAAEVGYKDPHYFSFVFKKTQGCTPREYRQSKD